MRREICLVIGLLVVLLFLFQSDVSFRYSSYVAGEWKYGYQADEVQLPGEQHPPPASKTDSVPELRMNDLVLQWDSSNPMPQTTLLQHASGMH